MKNAEDTIDTSIKATSVIDTLVAESVKTITVDTILAIPLHQYVEAPLTTCCRKSCHRTGYFLYPNDDNHGEYIGSLIPQDYHTIISEIIKFFKEETLNCHVCIITDIDKFIPSLNSTWRNWRTGNIEPHLLNEGYAGTYVPKTRTVYVNSTLSRSNNDQFMRIFLHEYMYVDDRIMSNEEISTDRAMTILENKYPGILKR